MATRSPPHTTSRGPGVYDQVPGGDGRPPSLYDPEAGTVRRLAPAGQALVVLLIALSLAALLNARGMHKTAAQQPSGAGRDVASALTSALTAVSGAFQLDEPRRALQSALGRAGDDDIDTDVEFVRRTPEAPRATKPVYSAANPLRLYVTGDSLLIDPGKALLERTESSRAIEAVTGVDTHAATGLAQPETFNWFEYLRQQARVLRPGLVVLGFGGNDGQGLSGTGGGDQPFGSPEWRAEYARRVGGVMDDLIAARVKVMWVSLPIPREADLAERFRVMNDIYRAEAERRRGDVYFLDMYRRFQDRSGRYADYLRDANGKLVRMRKPDGIHYELAGARIVAEEIVRRLPELVEVRDSG